MHKAKKIVIAVIILAGVLIVGIAWICEETGNSFQEQSEIISYEIKQRASVAELKRQSRDFPASSRNKIKLEDLKPDETVFAILTVNGFAGDLMDILVIDKDGNCKYIDLYNNEKPWDQDLLEFMDECLRNDEIPYLEQKLVLSKETLEAAVSTEDFYLKRIGGVVYDGGGLSYFCVYGCGEERELVEMQCYGSHEFHSTIKDAQKICEKMDILYDAQPNHGNSVYRNEWW